MRKRIATAGDRMLAAVLPHGTAGACIPTESCQYSEDGVCQGGWYYLTTCVGKTNCSGKCVVGVVCTRRKVGPC
jgi:hypothetical protein